jgi:hypothetical protein
MLIRTLSCVLIVDLWAYMHEVQAPPDGPYSFPGVVVAVVALTIVDIIMEKIMHK